MADYNYIEELGITCDMPCPDQKIKDALDTYRIKAQQSGSGVQMKKYTAMLGEFETNGSALFKQHQAELKGIAQKRLQDLIKLMLSLRCPKVIHPQRLLALANAMLLKKETVEKAFRDAGFNVKAGAANFSMEAYMIKDSLAKEFDQLFSRLRDYYGAVQVVDPSQQHLTQMKSVQNLYQFLAIYDAKNLGEAAYKGKTADELFGLCEKFNERDKLADNSSQTPRKEFKDIVSKGKTQVFKTDEMKSQYDHRLALEQSGIITDLTLIKNYPDAVKLEHSITEAFITQIINAEGCDRATAIAIYNDFVKPIPFLVDEETRIFVTCPTCHNISIFESEEEAHASECPHCHAKLFMKCPNPKCGRIVPAAAEHCQCGFSIAGLRFYKNYYDRCELAIRQQNLAAAHEEFNNAARSNPNGEGLKALEQKLEALEQALGKPLQEIGNLIDAKKMYAAQSAIAQLLREQPTADVAQFTAQINRAILAATTEYAKCRQPGITPAQKVEICARVLEIVSDYDAAVSEIVANPPDPAENVSASADPLQMACSIHWMAKQTNRNVNYTLVRKIGGRPQSVGDGVTVATNIIGTTYKDEKLEPGKEYNYAVFTFRAICPSSISRPAYPPQAVILLKDLTSFRAETNSQSCTLSWTDVPGSLGVSVERSDNNGSTWRRLSDRQQNDYLDKNGLQIDHIYRYRLCTAWMVDNRVMYSRGITRDVRIEVKPEALPIKAECTPDGNCRVSWNPHGIGVIWIYQLNDGVTVSSGIDYEQAQLEKLGKKVAQVPIGNGSANFMLGVGIRARLIALQPYGDRVIAGPTITVSTIPPMTIKEAVVVNNNLRVVLDRIPQNASKILYQVSTSSSHPYADETTARSGSMSAIDLEAYRAAGAIVVNKMPEELLYLSVLAQFGSGPQAYYSPVTQKEISNKPKEKIRYRIVWKEEGVFKKRKVRKDARLEVVLEGNRMPHMLLCAHRSGRMMFQYQPGNPEVVSLLEIEAGSSSNGTAIFPLDADRMRGLPANADLQVFLLDNESDRYDPPLCTDIPSRKLPMD